MESTYCIVYNWKKRETHVLKVHVNCEGCRLKVRKILRKIEGVYTVNINTEHQVVIVSGNVDSAVLIKKLKRSGKRAEVWSSSPTYNHKQEQSNMDQIQFSATNLDVPIDNFMFPASLGNEIEDIPSYENFSVDAMTDEDWKPETRMQNFYRAGTTFPRSVRVEDDMAFRTSYINSQDNGTGSVAYGGPQFHMMPIYEQNLLPSIAMTNYHQGYPYNYHQGYPYNTPSAQLN
ncbi:hypothetical protein Tsubulata_032162, partial [Turnera subulata]